MVRIIPALKYKIKNLFSEKTDFTLTSLHEQLNDYEYEIDADTYDDLLLPQFEKKYNKTFTTCGDEVFNHWLRSIKSKEQITALQSDISSLSASPHTAKIEKYLKKIGKQFRGNLTCDLWNGFNIKFWVIDNFYQLYALNILLSFCIFLLNTKILFLPAAFFCIFNLILFVLTNGKISRISGSIHYFLTVCVRLNKILKKTNIKLSIPVPNLREIIKVGGHSFLFRDGFGNTAGDIISLLLDYLRTFFCLELFAYKKVSKIVYKNRDELRRVIYFTGYLDCLLNTVRIMENSETVLSAVAENSSIEFLEIKHPLIEGSVGQSKNLERGVIITGLNMAGKTTFMKSLGLNQLLATSFGFAFAQSYSTRVLSILTSLKINDDILKSQSRYYAEAKRLSSIRERINAQPCLCLIDEILSGTNSDDRIYGATLILKEFASSSKSIILAATHDLSIAENLKELYDLAYFDGEIQDDKLIFDYMLKNGIVSKKNGLLILKLMGIAID